MKRIQRNLISWVQVNMRWWDDVMMQWYKKKCMEESTVNNARAWFFFDARENQEIIRNWRCKRAQQIQERMQEKSKGAHCASCLEKLPSEGCVWRKHWSHHYLWTHSRWKNWFHVHPYFCVSCVRHCENVVDGDWKGQGGLKSQTWVWTVKIGANAMTNETAITMNSEFEIVGMSGKKKIQLHI